MLSQSPISAVLNVENDHQCISVSRLFASYTITTCEKQISPSDLEKPFSHVGKRWVLFHKHQTRSPEVGDGKNGNQLQWNEFNTAYIPSWLKRCDWTMVVVKIGVVYIHLWRMSDENFNRVALTRAPAKWPCDVTWQDFVDKGPFIVYSWTRIIFISCVILHAQMGIRSDI